jgi:hypothetical protein
MEAVVSLFMVCHETGGSASPFFHAFSRERVKRRFLTSDVSAGNITMCRGQRIFPRATFWAGPVVEIQHGGHMIYSFNIQVDSDN